VTRIQENSLVSEIALNLNINRNFELVYVQFNTL